MTSLIEAIDVGGLRLPNRLYRAPVLEGAGSRRDAARHYARHFVPNARAGVGLIIQGNTIVVPEGRTSPGMTAIGEREEMLAMRSMTDAVHEAGARIIIQLGHGGVWSMESWHREAMAARTHRPWAPSPLPLWLRAVHSGVEVMRTEQVEALVRRFGRVAGWAREAGYDGVQLAASNAKLLHQFLSPSYNRRRDRYGGSREGRARILYEIREAIAGEAGRDYPVLLKYVARESGLGARLTLEEGVALGRLAESYGFAAVTPAAADVLPNTAICRGDFPAMSFRNENLMRRFREASGNRWRFALIGAGMWLGSRRYPFSRVWNRPVFQAVKAAVGIPVFAVGGIRSPGEAEAILRRGEADLVGIGRPFYAEPELARRFLEARSLEERLGEVRCESCNACVVPQMLGLPGICYNPKVNRKKRAS